MGFLHSQPKDWETTRWQSHVSATGSAPTLPVPTDGSYLFDAFIDVGAVSDTTSGPKPLQWSELRSFAEVYGGMAYWEVKVLREMSLDYIAGLARGKDPLGKPPWDEAILVTAHRMRRKE